MASAAGDGGEKKNFSKYIFLSPFCCCFFLKKKGIFFYNATMYRVFFISVCLTSRNTYQVDSYTQCIDDYYLYESAIKAFRCCHPVRQSHYRHGKGEPIYPSSLHTKQAIHRTYTMFTSNLISFSIYYKGFTSRLILFVQSVCSTCIITFYNHWWL